MDQGHVTSPHSPGPQIPLPIGDHRHPSHMGRSASGPQFRRGRTGRNFRGGPQTATPTAPPPMIAANPARSAASRFGACVTMADHQVWSTGGGVSDGGDALHSFAPEARARVQPKPQSRASAVADAIPRPRRVASAPPAIRTGLATPSAGGALWIPALLLHECPTLGQFGHLSPPCSRQASRLDSRSCPFRLPNGDHITTGLVLLRHRDSDNPVSPDHRRCTTVVAETLGLRASSCQSWVCRRAGDQPRCRAVRVPNSERAHPGSVRAPPFHVEHKSRFNDLREAPAVRFRASRGWHGCPQFQAPP